MTPEELEKLSFEQALEKLENLVGKMETGRLPLEELMGDFENGSQLVNFCRSKLDVLERRIELLLRDDGKEGSWTDFEPDSSPSPDSPRDTPPF